MPGPCPECGYPVSDGEEFCSNPSCGAYLGWGKDAADPTTPTMPGGPAPDQPATHGPQAGPRTRRSGAAHVAALSTSQLSVAPGESAELTVTVTNTSSVVDELSVAVAGPLASYTVVQPPALQVYPHDHATARVLVAPPHSTGLRAGDHPLVLRLTSALGDGWSEHVCTVGIGAFTGLTPRLVPPQSQGRGRRVRTSVEVTNRGNAPLRVTAVPRDDNGRIRWGGPTVGVVEPGSTSSLVLVGRTGRRWFGDPEQRPYDVTVQGVPDPVTGGPPTPDQRLHGRRDQIALLSGWRIWVLVVAVLAAMGLVAFLIVDTDLLGRDGPVVEVPVEVNGQVELPDLVGEDGDSAVTALQDAGLEVVVVEQDSQRDAGVVLAQDPPAGTEVEPGSTVSLLVSAGGTGPDEAVCAQAGEARQILDEQGASDEAAQALAEVVESTQSDGVDGTLVDRGSALASALDAGDVASASAVVDEILAFCG